MPICNAPATRSQKTLSFVVLRVVSNFLAFLKFPCLFFNVIKWRGLQKNRLGRGLHPTEALGAETSASLAANQEQTRIQRATNSEINSIFEAIGISRFGSTIQLCDSTCATSNAEDDNLCSSQPKIQSNL